jgi:hypothetical protein
MTTPINEKNPYDQCIEDVPTCRIDPPTSDELDDIKNIEKLLITQVVSYGWTPSIFLGEIDKCGFYEKGIRCNENSTSNIGEHMNVSCPKHSAYFNIYHNAYKSMSKEPYQEWKMRVDVYHIFPRILDYGHIHRINVLQTELYENNIIGYDDLFKICRCKKVSTYKMKQKFIGSLCYECYKIVSSMYPSINTYNLANKGWNGKPLAKISFTTTGWMTVDDYDQPISINLDISENTVVMGNMDMVYDCGW